MKEIEYETEERRSTYTIFFDDEQYVDWHWDLNKEVRLFDKLWNDGIPLSEIAEILDKQLVSVRLLKIDRLLRGRIEERPYDDYGNIENFIRAYASSVKKSLYEKEIQSFQNMKRGRKRGRS